jgi:hypothetical protein
MQEIVLVCLAVFWILGILMWYSVFSGLWLETNYQAPYLKSSVLSQTWTEYKLTRPAYQDRYLYHFQTWTTWSTCECFFSDATFSNISSKITNACISPFFHLFLFPLWAVTWTTIQLVGKFRLNYLNYQYLLTCKLVIGHIDIS